MHIHKNYVVEKEYDTDKNLPFKYWSRIIKEKLINNVDDKTFFDHLDETNRNRAPTMKLDNTKLSNGQSYSKKQLKRISKIARGGK